MDPSQIKTSRLVKRRGFLATGAALLACPSLAGAGVEAPAELRIGYQKSGVLAIAKQQKLLETRFASQHIAIKWVEFPFGPPLLEALNAGSLDYGYTGDAPPIFAQAARANLLYVAVLPARGDNEAILVPPESPLKTLSDLKGKKVGLAKASSAHSLVASALESIGLPFTAITPVYLAPADAAAAFARGSIDAWSIWDPFMAIAEITRNARRLPVAPEASTQNSFFLANRGFTDKHPEIVSAINEEIARASRWSGEHRDEAAQQFAATTGVDIEAERRTVGRSEFNFSPVTDAIIRQQQAVADRFLRLGLLPAPVTVADIVWKWKPVG